MIIDPVMWACHGAQCAMVERPRYSVPHDLSYDFEEDEFPMESEAV